MVVRKGQFSYDDLPDPHRALEGLKAYAKRRLDDNIEAYRRTVEIALQLEYEADGLDLEDLALVDDLSSDRSHGI